MSSSFRLCAPRGCIGAALLAAGLCLTAPAGLQAAVGEGQDVLLPATPLFLKDGRLARVSVHVVPFGHDAASLTGPAASKLKALTQAIATDCFLSAQVIGQVDAEEAAARATLDAHRLARARADAVQAALVAGGLDAEATASVWDWKFLQKSAQATVWVFRLAPGEDCEEPAGAGDTPVAAIEPATKPVPATRPKPAPAVAAAPAPAVTAKPAKVAPATPAPVAPPAAPATPLATPSTTAKAAREAAPAAMADAAPTGKVSPEAALAAVVASGSGASVTQPLPPRQAARPSAPVALPALAKPATPSPAVQSATLVPAGPSQATPAKAPVAAAAPSADAPVILPANAPAEPGAVAAHGEAGVTIVFPNNSSYFPPGTRAALQQLVEGLAPEATYQLRLVASVGSADQVSGAPSNEEAARYNQWLAERRMDRVKTWLEQHSGSSKLQIERSLRKDESRQVQVQLVPTS